MQQTQFVSKIRCHKNGHAVIVPKVLALTQSSPKAVTAGFKRDALKTKEGLRQILLLSVMPVPVTP